MCRRHTLAPICYAARIGAPLTRRVRVTARHGQTWFFHRGVYAAPLDAAPGDVTLLDVHCPTCGARYAATLDYSLVPPLPPRLEAHTTEAAAALLAGECPDHPHRFAVGG